MQAKASNPITSFLKAWFGDFQKEELKKFLKLGVIFAFVIGVYWTLRPLKDSIFSSMAHADNQPVAKLVSLLVLFPLVMIYSKLVDKFARHKLFYVIGGAYFIGYLDFGLTVLCIQLLVLQILPLMLLVLLHGFGMCLLKAMVQS